MSKHTPGPWCVRHDDMVCSQEGRIIADCESTPYAMRPAPPIVEDKANATLIAAAPAMYEALVKAMVLIDIAALEEENRAYRGEQQPITSEARDRQHLAQAALAQAEGRG